MARIRLSAEERRTRNLACTAAWRKKNPDRVKIKNAEWKALNEERRKKADAAWCAANKEKIRDAHVAFYILNRDKVIEASADWAKNNPEKDRAARAAWRKANPEKVKNRHNAYRTRNPEKVKRCRDEWKKKNPEIIKIQSHTRRARKKANGGKLSPGISLKLLSLQRGKCAICKKSLKKSGFHLDHIIPLSRGGANVDQNIQLTCPSCNIKKGGKDPIQFMQSLGYLL